MTIQNSLMEKEKRYWTIKVKVSRCEIDFYYNVEDLENLMSGLIRFTDPDTQKKVWVGPGTPWIATEQKEKRPRRG